MRKKIKNPVCAVCEARQNSVLAEVREDKLSKMMQGKTCTFYQKGQIIFHEGNYPHGLYCLHDGKVKIYKTGEIGKEQIVRLAKGGDILGYRSLISGEPYRASAQTFEDSFICYIPRESVFDLLQKDPEFSMHMMQLVCHDLGQSENRLLNLAQKPVRERLAEVLLILKETYGLEEDQKTLNILLTREDIADIVGTATETVIRLMSEFKQEKLIAASGRKIQLLNIRGLIKTGNVYD